MWNVPTLPAVDIFILGAIGLSVRKLVARVSVLVKKYLFGHRKQNPEKIQRKKNKYVTQKSALVGLGGNHGACALKTVLMVKIILFRRDIAVGTHRRE